MDYRHSGSFSQLPGIGHPTLPIRQSNNTKERTEKKVKNSQLKKYSSTSILQKRICVIGSEKAGKTHFISSLASFNQGMYDDVFVQSSDFIKSKTISVPLEKLSDKKDKNGHYRPILCEIVLTEVCSNKNCDRIRQEELLKSHAAIIVYSPSERFSFWDVSERWIPFIEEILNNPIPIMIICNIR